MEEQREMGFMKRQARGEALRVGPITLGGLGSVLDAIGAGAGGEGGGARPKVARLPELAARLVAGCTRLEVEEVRELPALEALGLVERCLETNDLAELVARARHAVRTASGTLAAPNERSLR